ncbi:L-seryl-tRNA(Sec) selenium transferase [Roseovarius aestuarii]|jgi:L-seryl-tRNA(Ser) seleniumtransferase|uniref:L-seryl-tRNA(Sec) selenium transferase n=1 Tax=Roseovarius aestuarii TaxID=475083 RepID=A0A1X7BKX3_9RHOB|nr:L-seryl-tRNA(Sec) selenium transferase [Roseovarius aestuarii]SMC10308.1 L-seryl-tRNA(Sec) selenium transferase [Roseovarius aestuarii]
MTRIEAPQHLPSVDRLVNTPAVQKLVRDHGLALVTRCTQGILARVRLRVLAGESTDMAALIQSLSEEIEHILLPSLRPVYNLTGTVLHTNLGRAPLPQSAIQAMVDVSRGASNVEFNLETGKRGDRHRHAEALLCQLTGAEGALVVNNNAAAVLLTLNSLAQRKEVPVSRGELIEIGGAFRMPDIMARAGCKLVEVGTTNRTHDVDFEAAIGPRTALLMKVHTSNFEMQGFTKNVSEQDLAEIAHRHDLPLVTDLGSGTLIDLEPYNLPHETTVTEALQAGADLVTFSGDKLLGGPQAGIIAGRRDLIDRLKRNPMTRAMRPDKLTLAALQAVLQLYTNPERLVEELPALRLLMRDPAEIEHLAMRLVIPVQECCQPFDVAVAQTYAQVGSGALPIDRLESTALKITRPDLRRPGAVLNRLAKAFRGLLVPVIGRISDDALWFDLRCLEDEDGFVENLAGLTAQ